MWLTHELAAEDSAETQFPRIRIKILSLIEGIKVPSPSYSETAWGDML